MLPHFSLLDWLLAIMGAACIGLSKSGFSGISLLTVMVMAHLFTARASTGVVLPLLIFGDVCSVWAFRTHAVWPHIRRTLGPAMAGVVLGWLIMGAIPDRQFAPVIGWIVIGMIVLQTVRQIRPGLFESAPHTRGFALAMGLLAGVTTMLANAAGPIMALYLLSINLPKYALIGTAAFFFLFINLFKVPFSASLGLIHGDSLMFDLVLAPVVLVSTFAGRRLVSIVPQRLFETLLLCFAGLAAFRLIGLF